MKRSRRTSDEVWLLRAGLMLLVVGLVASVAGATSHEGGKRGEGEYMKYCASCHGVDGKGVGPAAASLKTAPADLTKLAERYGEPLPRNKLTAFIDGRRPLIAHGSRDMPIWGERLWEDLPSRTPEARKRGTILVIIDYLDSIQPGAD